MGELDSGRRAEALDIAKYFTSRDPERCLFGWSHITLNQESHYAGCIRLNCYCHLAQMLCIAQLGTKLFDDAIYATSTGPVIPAVTREYTSLLQFDIPSPISRQEGKIASQIMRRFDRLTIQEVMHEAQSDPAYLRAVRSPLHLREMDMLPYQQIYQERYRA